MKDIKILILHEKDGIYQYNIDEFERCKPSLIRTINIFIKDGIIPNVGDYINGDDCVYYIKKKGYGYIGASGKRISFWVNENQD